MSIFPLQLLYNENAKCKETGWLRETQFVINYVYFEVYANKRQFIESDQIDLWCHLFQVLIENDMNALYVCEDLQEIFFYIFSWHFLLFFYLSIFCPPVAVEQNFKPLF